MITLHEINVAATALERDMKSFRAYLAVLERAEPRLTDAEREASLADAMATFDGFFDRMADLRAAAEQMKRQRPVVDAPPEEPPGDSELSTGGEIARD